jgi:hypothetical protein
MGKVAIGNPLTYATNLHMRTQAAFGNGGRVNA